MVEDASHDSTLDRLTVAEAAEALGVSPSAVRKRVERGTLAADKDGDGRLFVYLDPTETRRETPRDTSRDRDSRDELVEELREQNRFLRAELERKDAILMSLTQRVPELEPASEPRESPETASGPAEGVEVPGEERRPWWRRMFGA
jgi:excisionase family DNA binding protein